MTLLDEGLEELSSQFISLITKGQWGIGTALPTPSDTGLGSAIAASLLTLSGKTASGNSASFTHNLPSTAANSNDLTEFELQFSNGDSLNRTLNGAISKTASFDVTTIVTVNFVRV